MKKESNVSETNLLCFLYGAVKETELCQKYITDANETHDPCLAEFFREIQAQDRLRVWRIEEFLRRQENKIG